MKSMKMDMMNMMNLKKNSKMAVNRTFLIVQV